MGKKKWTSEIMSHLKKAFILKDRDQNSIKNEHGKKKIEHGIS